MLFYGILHFEHVDGYDFKPSQAFIDKIKADAEKQTASQISLKPIGVYSTVAVLYSGLQKFSNPTGEYSKHIIDCSQGFLCVAKDVIGTVSNKYFQILTREYPRITLDYYETK